MAWTSSNPVTSGDPTKKAHYDSLWDNAVYVYDFIVARSLWIFESAAPTGWEIISDCTDGLIAIKGGAIDYNVAGGSKLQGSWSHADHSHTYAGWALTLSEIPEHTHGINPPGLTATAGAAWIETSTANQTAIAETGSYGGGGSHSHSVVPDATANTWRPLANVGILIVKTAGADSWTGTNPTTIGAATEKQDYDALWYNVTYLYDTIALRYLFLFENLAPTGWEIVTACADGLLAVKGGTGSYNVAGGTALQGTWTMTLHVHTTGTYSLVEADIPAHVHPITPNINSISGTTVLPYPSLESGTEYEILQTTNDTESTGSGTAHGHGDFVGSYTPITWRPLANVGIVVKKT